MYYPEEDSFFLAKILLDYIKKLGKKKDKIKYLDMGTGSGILSETALRAGLEKENILAVDIDSESVNFVKNKGFNVVRSDLFSKLKGKKFDLISFNAPYLPEDKYDKKIDTTGGKKGDEISIKFLKQAKKHLNSGGKIFLLISSITPYVKIKKFKPKLVEKKRVFFEDIVVLEFS